MNATLATFVTSSCTVMLTGEVHYRLNATVGLITTSSCTATSTGDAKHELS